MSKGWGSTSPPSKKTNPPCSFTARRQGKPKIPGSRAPLLPAAPAPRIQLPCKGLKTPACGPYSTEHFEDSHARIYPPASHRPEPAAVAAAPCGGVPPHGHPAVRRPPQEHQGAGKSDGGRPPHHAGGAESGGQGRALGVGHVRCRL